MPAGCPSTGEADFFLAALQVTDRPDQRSQRCPVWRACGSALSAELSEQQNKVCAAVGPWANRRASARPPGRPCLSGLRLGGLSAKAGLVWAILPIRLKASKGTADFGFAAGLARRRL